jgi:hypothetical protein
MIVAGKIQVVDDIDEHENGRRVVGHIAVEVAGFSLRRGH